LTASDDEPEEYMCMPAPIAEPSATSTASLRAVLWLFLSAASCCGKQLLGGTLTSTSSPADGNDDAMRAGAGFDAALDGALAGEENAGD